LKKTLASVCVTSFASRLVLKSFSTLSLGPVIAHEYGHYFVAKGNDLKPKEPIIIAIGPIHLGYVKTLKGNTAQRKKVGFAGPLAGIVTSSMCVGLFSIAGLYIPMYISLLCLLSEFMNLMFGSDSKRIFL